MAKKINWLSHFIELIIVITGVSVAFWLSNLATKNKEHELEKTFITNLRSDIIQDSASLAYAIKFNKRKIEILSQGLELMGSDTEKKHADSLIQYLGNIGNFNFFRTESFTLTSLLQSGDIKLLRSVELKNELLRLLRNYEQITFMQDNWLEALDASFFPLMNQNIDMVTFKPINEDFIYDIRIKNYWVFTIADTDNLNVQYQHTLKQIDKVLKIIDEGK